MRDWCLPLVLRGTSYCRHAKYGRRTGRDPGYRRLGSADLDRYLPSLSKSSFYYMVQFLKLSSYKLYILLVRRDTRLSP